MTASHSSELKVLLKQETSLSESLQHCLNEEKSALISLKLDQLNPLISQKNQFLKQLQQAASKRQQWLQVNGFLSSDIAVAQLTALEPELADLWSGLEQSVKNNQHQNLVNGEIISQSKSRNQQMMNILGIQSRQSSVYTGNGKTDGKGSGFSIAKA